MLNGREQNWRDDDAFFKTGRCQGTQESFPHPTFCWTQHEDRRLMVITASQIPANKMGKHYVSILLPKACENEERHHNVGSKHLHR